MGKILIHNNHKKYLVLSLTKKTKDFYSENFKTLKKETEAYIMYLIKCVCEVCVQGYAEVCLLLHMNRSQEKTLNIKTVSHCVWN